MGYKADVTDADSVSWTSGASKAYWTLLSPTSDVTLREIYGPSIDQNYVSQGGPSYYRLEAFSTANKLTDKYLAVIQPVSSSDSKVTTNLLSTIDPDYIGAEIRAATKCLVLFSKDGTDQNSISFSITDSSGTLKAVVANLSPGSYFVKQGTTR